jgi:hypothetical protein
MGIDVMVPVEDGRIDVYQVKRYDRPLTASQWRKVKQSHDTLVDAVNEGHVAVRNWYLAMPLDESDVDEQKFDGIVAGGPFELCEWKGLAWLDALASEYPEVVDYYLADGKARLEQAHRDLMTVLGTRGEIAGGSVAALETSDGLIALHRELNRHDHLYRYDFAVGDAESRDSFIPADLPHTLVFVAQMVEGPRCVTWHVHARCDESLRVRPIPIELSFDLGQDTALTDALQLFADYGKPFKTEGAVTVSLDLPGGFGGTRKNGSVWIGPTAEDAARRYVMRLRVVGPDGVISGPVTLDMDAPTVGARGVRLAGEHHGGAFAFEALHDVESATMNVRFSGLKLAGKPVASVIGGVEFIRQVAGRDLEVGAEHGPFLAFGKVPPRGGDERSDESLEQGEAVLDALRSLAALQQHTSTTVRVPDLDRTTRGEVREWKYVARILAGETVVDPRLGKLQTELQEAPTEPIEGDHAFAFDCALAAQVGDERIILGQQVLHISAAHVASHHAHAAKLTITPKPGAKWTRRLTQNTT